VEALDYLKSHWNIIHRNVRPSHILVSRTTIKLCDFVTTGQTIDDLVRKWDYAPLIHMAVNKQY
jgi:serine/threonine protein kinase